MYKILILFISFILRPLFKYFPVKKDLWVFGAEDGQSFIDNSKFLFEYMLQNELSIKIVWITRSKNLIKKLKNQNYPVKNNLSLLGIWYIIRANIVVFSTSRNDILFIHQKKKRKIVNLWHGMPIKKIVYDYEPHRPDNKNLRARIWDYFVAGINHNKVDIIVSTSPFYNGILSSSFRNENVFTTGQPRTDAFFIWDKKSVKEKLGFSMDEKIVTYMPTHRAYGSGKMNPKIFENDNETLEFFQKNKVKLVWKYHKNMLKEYQSNSETSHQIIDITSKSVDPQELLFISDILITDYSSCYIDYLILDRPIVFYHYDDYEQLDNEVYFSINEKNPGPIVRDENTLGKVIQSLINGEDYYAEKRQKYLKLYHTYLDGKSSKRVVELIKKKNKC